MQKIIVMPFEHEQIKVAESSDTFQENEVRIDIGECRILLTREQSEKLFETLEQFLYDESEWHSTLSNKLLKLQVKLDRIQDMVNEYRADRGEVAVSYEVF